MLERNGRRWVIAFLLLGVGAPLAGATLQIGWRVVTVCYYATKLKLKGGSRDLPIAPYASSEAALARVGTSVAAVEQIRKRLHPRGELLLLVSTAPPMDRGSLYLQMSYFLAPRAVAQLDCAPQPYLLTGAAGEQRLAGVVYYAMSPPPWIVAGRPAVAVSGDGAKRLLFVPFTGQVKEISDWTQFCR